MNEIETKRQKYYKWGQIAVIGVLGLIASPIVFLAIKGIIGLMVAATLGLAAITFAPYISMKFANWKVAAIVAEAKENPIETMEKLLIAKKQAYREFYTQVETAVTACKQFESKTKQFAIQYPTRAPEFQKQLDQMKQLVEAKKVSLKRAQGMLEEGDRKLVEMKAYWDMSQAAQAANKAAGMNTGDLYDELKASTAVDAVFESMNRAFAELEVATSMSMPMIENSPQPIIESTLKSKSVISV
jgi:Tfp pilus assembly protein FimV